MIKEKGIEPNAVGVEVISDANLEKGIKEAARENFEATKKVLEEKGISNMTKSIGDAKFFVSDTPHNFESMASMFLGLDVRSQVTQIDIEQY